MKGKSLVIIFLLLLCFYFFSSCIKDSNEVKFERQELEDGFVYHVKRGDSLMLDIGFHHSGELHHVSNFPSGYEQAIFFHKHNGIVQSKLKIDSLDRAFGRAYYFYDRSGDLSSDYNYEDGLRTGSAVSYHDSTGRIREVMLYNDKGELYYRKTFDKYGNHIKTEGGKN